MDKKTKLFTASQTGDIDTLEKIIEENRDLIEETNNENLTPLAEALYSNQPDALQLLINNGAKLNTPGRDGKTTLEWAREQNESIESAASLLLTDYMDRLYNTAVWWTRREEDIKNTKLKEGEILPDVNCDACGCIINSNDSILLSLDEALSTDKYTDKLVNQAIKINQSQETEENKEKIKELICTQIRDNNLSSTYTVCNSCRDKMFSDTIFGQNREFILESIDKLFKDQI